MAHASERYTIDGTCPSDRFTYTGGLEARTPWVVFDIQLQRNVAGPFTFRWQARQALDRILAGADQVPRSAEPA